MQDYENGFTVNKTIYKLFLGYLTIIVNLFI